MRLRNERITLGLKRKALNPVHYEMIDNRNVRIRTKWFQFYLALPRQLGLVIWGPKDGTVLGVTIYHDGAKQFISNSWYLDEEIDRL